MADTPYRHMPAKLAGREEFHGSTVRAFLDDRGNYRVFSYDTEIAAVYDEHGRLLRWVSPQRYSQTTSKIQHLCLEHLPGRDVDEGSGNGMARKRFNVDRARAWDDPMVANAIKPYVLTVDGHPITDRQSNGQTFWMVYRNKATAESGWRRASAEQPGVLIRKLGGADR